MSAFEFKPNGVMAVIYEANAGWVKITFEKLDAAEGDERSSANKN